MDENTNTTLSIDLSDGTLGIAQEKANETWSQTFSNFKQRESNWALNFKILSFCAVLILAIIFLITGLCITSQSVMHISNLQEKQLDLIERNLSSKIEKLQVTKSTIVASPLPEPISALEKKLNGEKTGIPLISSANAKEQEKSLPTSQQVQPQSSNDTNSNSENTSNAEKTLTITIATGSIITLIAFILGVGLTLLLTLMKFTFTTDEPAKDNTNNITFAGPLSELITQFASYIRSKIK